MYILDAQTRWPYARMHYDAHGFVNTMSPDEPTATLLLEAHSRTPFTYTHVHRRESTECPQIGRGEVAASKRGSSHQRYSVKA